MKVKFLILVAFFVLGLTACRNKKAGEAEKMVKEKIGKPIVFLAIPYSKAKTTLKYAVTGCGCTKFKNANDIWWLCKNNLACLGGCQLPITVPRLLKSWLLGF